MIGVRWLWLAVASVALGTFLLVTIGLHRGPVFTCTNFKTYMGARECRVTEDDRPWGDSTHSFAQEKAQCISTGLGTHNCFPTLEECRGYVRGTGYSCFELTASELRRP